MIRLSRLWLSLVALSYGLHHTALGFIYRPTDVEIWQQLLPTVLFLIALLMSVLISGDLKLPLWVALVVFSISIYIPMLVNPLLSLDAIGSYSTWYVAGISTLMVILTIRKYPVMAAVGMSLVVLQVLIWGGFETLFQTGIGGALLLVAAAQGTAIAIDRSEKLAAEYLADVSRSIEGEQQTTEARKISAARLQRALNESLPMLQTIVDRNGRLNKTEIAEARLLEAQLRDDIRGAGLNTESVKSAVRMARRRGVDVQLLDDGGLDQLDASRRSEIETSILEVLAKVQVGKVVIRSAKGSGWTVTIAAMQENVDQPDVFLRL